MCYKKFSKFLFIILLSFVLINIIIWRLFTKDILTRQDSKIMTGNVSRMGYLPQFNHERTNNINLPKKHLNHKKYNNQRVDMITIGDSFSQGNAGGLNRFYQDYLASYTNLNILNIQQILGSRNYIETIVMLYNSGILKKLKTKYILIESTQRKVVSRFEIPVNFFEQVGTNNINNFLFKKVDNTNFRLPDVAMINNGNFKYLLYSLLYNFSTRAFISKIHHVKLSKKLFSIQDGNDLLFYNSDLTAIRKNTRERIYNVNKNLNKLANLLKLQNIKLIFMPAVGKYDLYSNYIVNNNFKKDPFFNYYREMDKDYIFIDTKKILLEQIIKKEKDIFYCDDTHWSYKASDIISQDIKNKLKGNK